MTFGSFFGSAPGGPAHADGGSSATVADLGDVRRIQVLASEIAGQLAEDDSFVQRLAVAVVSEMRSGPAVTGTPLTVAEVAAMAGRSEDWVRDHRDELGLVTVGDGPRPRLMFDPTAVRERLSAGQCGQRSQRADAGVVEPMRRGRPRGATGAGVDLLPIGGRRAA